MGEAKFNHFDKPAYPYSEAAQYLSLPCATLRAWFLGYTATTKSGSKRRGARLIEPASTKHLSFFNLIEAQVLAAIRREHRVAPDKVRGALRYTSERLGVERPLLHTKFHTDGVGLFVDHLEGLIDVSAQGQHEIRDVFEAHLARIERDSKGIPIKLFPFMPGALLTDKSKQFEINPSVAFGRPTIAGSGISVETIVDRFNAGDSVKELVEDYSLSSEQIETAIRLRIREKKAA